MTHGNTVVVRLNMCRLFMQVPALVLVWHRLWSQALLFYHLSRATGMTERTLQRTSSRSLVEGCRTSRSRSISSWPFLVAHLCGLVVFSSTVAEKGGVVYPERSDKTATLTSAAHMRWKPIVSAHNIYVYAATKNNWTCGYSLVIYSFDIMKPKLTKLNSLYSKNMTACPVMYCTVY